MHCKHCGHKVLDEAVICPSCGCELKEKVQDILKQYKEQAKINERLYQHDKKRRPSGAFFVKSLLQV